MRTATLLLAILAIPSNSVFAAFTDFSDFTQTESFDSGEVFESNGLRFKAVDLLSTGTSAFVFSILATGPGVEFLLPTGVQEISFAYSNGGGRKIIINGVEPVTPLDASLSFLDGTTVAGVSVSTVVDFQAGGSFGITQEEGILTLQGPINAFVIAGVEMLIDDITIIVPEPSTLLLSLLGLPFVCLRQRRKLAKQKVNGCAALG